MTFTEALVKVIFVFHRNPNPYQLAQTKYKHITIDQSVMQKHLIKIH